MTYRRLIYSILCSTIIFFSLQTTFAQGTPEAGEKLFKANCASCHAKDMKTKLTGPALAGVVGRWEDGGYPMEDLYGWIRNSQKLVSEGHPYAVALFNEYNKSVMNAFPNLTDQDIESLLAYIDGVSNGTYGVQPGTTVGDPGINSTESGSNWWVYAGIIGLLALLAFILSNIASGMSRDAALARGEDYETKSWYEMLTSKSTIAFLVFAGIIIGGYTTVNNAIAFNRQINYGPEQPINFSHELHAGINGIDCQYCHDGARRSKHAVIPAVNTCMNCHTAVKGKKYEDSERAVQSKVEISKIYAATGWDPIGGKYMDDYKNMASEDISKTFTKWFEDHYLERAELDREKNKKKADRLLEEVKGDVANHVETVMGFAQKPVEWVRIHNLPDHAYFNHSQHVTVGGLECQTCHGPVEEMEVVYQHSPLSMGWCINCHRKTEVKFADNDYYDAYMKLHDDLKSGKIDKVTVEDIGGLECQKCHY